MYSISSGRQWDVLKHIIAVSQQSVASKIKSVQNQRVGNYVVFAMNKQLIAPYKDVSTEQYS